MPSLQREPNADFFAKPVDPVGMNLPDYTTVIKKPMDLGTIETKLEARAYQHPGEFIDDTRLVWANARLYNSAGTIVHQAAVYFRNVFERNLFMMVRPGQPPPPQVMAAAAAPPASLVKAAPPPVKAAPPAAAPLPAAPAPAAPPAMPVKTAAPPVPKPAPKPAPPAASSSAVEARAPSPYVQNLPTGAEAVSQMYTKVVRFMRQHQMAKYFRDPVPWEKLGLATYPEVVKHPMDLLTVLRKLERREYLTVEALRADVDLIWDNCILFNGDTSWMKRYVDAMRSVSARKFAEAAARPLGLVRKPSAVRVGGARPPIGGVGNVPIGNGGAHFITPQMRLQLLESSVRLRDEERVQLGVLAKDLCPAAVESVAEGRETKIDVDALDPKTFMRLDMHVRRMIAMGAARA